MVVVPTGVCSKEIHIEVENGVIQSLHFVGGCNGNLKGIAAICKGKTVEEVVAVFKGITCGTRPTSCPDQLARALEAI